MLRRTQPAHMKWLVKLAGGGKKERTPVPPKPYKDRFSSDIQIKEMKHREDLANIDPERPHWRDPKFESRESVPFFDLFGFNRNWSFTIFKCGCIIIVASFFQETRLMMTQGDEAMMTTTTSVMAVPKWARDEEATEKELREAGFAYVGVKQLDNVGANEDEKAAKKH